MDDWTIEAVAARFEEAVITGRRLPRVGMQGFASSWPPIVRQEWERLVAEETPQYRPPPDAKATERMLETMRWVQWLEVETRHLLWMRAKRYEWHQIGRRFGCDRTTAWRRWTKALQTIADRLNASKSSPTMTKSAGNPPSWINV